MNCFSECPGLSPIVLGSLERMQFKSPTPIQAQAIPLILAGRDVLGSAQTGTGKTGAFAIPMVSKLLEGQIQGALVLTPTRELATQVMVTIEQLLGKNSAISTAVLIGGEDIRRQLQQLRKNPRIIVGTPGRINDHIERGSVSFSKTNYIVLDETDRMLDMGFGQQIDSIIAEANPERQTLMFSATMPNNIMKMASKYLSNPERIAIGSCLQPIAAISQENISCTEQDKYNQLLDQLQKKDGSVVVFCRTKFGAKKLADRLYGDRFQAQAIHGNLRQNARDRVIQGFKNKKFRILVATDVAARGLDVPHIQLVVNHDLPQCPEDYIHRVGRTARAGATGNAVNFITDQERNLWRAIERFMKTGDQEQSGHQPRSGGGNNRRFNDRFGSKGGGRRGDSRGEGSRGRFSKSSSGSRFGGRRFENKDESFSSNNKSDFDFDREESAPRSFKKRFDNDDQSSFGLDRSERFDRSDRSSDRSERPQRSGGGRFDRFNKSSSSSSSSSSGKKRFFGGNKTRSRSTGNSVYSSQA